MRFAPLLALLVFAAAPAIAQDAGPKVYSGNFAGADHDDHGTLSVTAAPNGVILHVDVKGLAPGWHGMHFHEKGACDDEKFASAGGHVHNATPVVHGYLSAGANDAGDLPNLYVGPDGQGHAEVYSSLVTATKVDDRPYLIDDDGSAVVIHDLPDDYLSQPIGNAGARAACAVIQ
ncbi:MAG: superoxide dismutase family protein [Asticcacaulis sp.]|nr:superoxide dismutase family protein [Asticcacaulis sp.]